MNKAITDGLLLMPPAFEQGLDVYSSGDGTPGSDTYVNAGNAAFVPADQDFGGCLEISKASSVEQLRYMGETPLLPGCYLKISAKVKAVSGPLPAIRVGAYAGGAGGAPVPGVALFGPSVDLVTYGEIVEVSAIVGTGARGGVDMSWGTEAIYGHFGLDITGPLGGTVRIDDLVIEDVTSVFLREMLAQVDVRDYGALGDGSTDDTAAFVAANAAAVGRKVLVPEGTYYLASAVTFDAPVQFEGTVTMPTDAMLLLRANFDLPTYIDAFGDEEVAFRKGFQALLNNSDHESFDLGGRKVSVTQPIDMQAAVPNRTSYATRRVIRNGQLEAQGATAWDTEVVTSQGSYSPSNNLKLTQVINVANVPVGALVEGVGVGREIYVQSKNVATQEVTLSAPLFDAEGTQEFTFKRFKYLLDFSGFDSLSKMVLDDIEFQCNRLASGIMLAPAGLIFHMRDCFISRPKDRGLSSHGSGCQGMLIDRCQFLSAEDALDVPDRVSIGFNSNGNDIKLRNCRATRFRHFGIIGGANSIIAGNHFFQGDAINNGIRSAGLVIARTNASSTFTGNYVDNCFFEWTNEQDSAPEFNSEFSFSGLSIADNIFLSGAAAPWFSYIVVKPHGAGHFLNGVSVTGNTFRSFNGNIDRAERVDTSFADLDYGRFENIVFSGNSFLNVDAKVSSPLALRHNEASTGSVWVIEADQRLPFNAAARSVDAVVARGMITNSSDVPVFASPAVATEQGPQSASVHLTWPEAVRGEVQLTLRMDG